jgi:hypothetical protein
MIPTRFQDFEPFWEFVSGPIHAGTFGPQVVYAKAPSKEQGANLPPSLGMQFFGHVAIDGGTEVMTVTLRDVGDNSLWSTALEPREVGHPAVGATAPGAQPGVTLKTELLAWSRESQFGGGPEKELGLR